MYGFIFGFQRRVWCPKGTPASKSCFIVTALLDAVPFLVASSVRRRISPSSRTPRLQPRLHQAERADVCDRPDDTGGVLRLENRRLGQPVPEGHHGLGVDLTDPGLGHAEHLADLGQGQALVVV